MTDAVNNTTKVPTGQTSSTTTVSVKKSLKSHPRTAEMVNTAIMVLKERHGSSLQAIKKYITMNYDVDVDKLSPFIKRYVRAAVANGTLVQTRGKGASGSFKMPPLRKKYVKPKIEAEQSAAKMFASEEEQKLSPKITQKLKKKVATITATNKSQRIARKTPKKSSSPLKKALKSPTSKPRTPRPKKIANTKSSKKTVAAKK